MAPTASLRYAIMSCSHVELGEAKQSPERTFRQLMTLCHYLILATLRRQQGHEMSFHRQSAAGSGALCRTAGRLVRLATATGSTPLGP